MKITLSSPTHLRIEWPLHSSAIEAEIRRRLNTVPGIEAGYGRVASAPVIQLARLIDLFPKASFDYRAMQESDRLAERFWRNLVSMGIELAFDEFEAVCGVSENVSPLLQQLIHERSHALRPFLLEKVNKVHGGNEQSSRPSQPSTAHLYPRATKRRRKAKA